MMMYLPQQGQWKMRHCSHMYMYVKVILQIKWSFITFFCVVVVFLVRFYSIQIVCGNIS